MGDQLANIQNKLADTGIEINTSRNKGIEILVTPQNKEQLSDIVKLLAAMRVAIVPIGTGSHLKVNVQQDKQQRVTVGVSTAKLNRIEELEKENMSFKVQAGMIAADLNKELSKSGLFIPLSGLSIRNRTIGGLVAENASGWEAYTYGSLRDNILGMEVILPSGEVIRVGGKTIKNVSGYELSSLFAGSMGTLGIIYSITFHAKPKKEQCLAVIGADSMGHILEIAENIRNNKNIFPASIHILKNYINDHIVHLVVDIRGSKSTIKRQIEEIMKISAQRCTLLNEVSALADFWSKIGDCQAILDKTPFQKIYVDRRYIRKFGELIESLQPEQCLLDLCTGYGYIYATEPLLQQFLQQARSGSDELIFTAAQHKIPYIFRLIKETVDPNNIMFPCSPLSEEAM